MRESVGVLLSIFPYILDTETFQFFNWLIGLKKSALRKTYKNSQWMEGFVLKINSQRWKIIPRKQLSNGGN